MKLFTDCKKCKEPITLKHSANDRAELSKKQGDELVLTCLECMAKNRYHVNEIVAKANKVIAVTAFVIVFLGIGAAGYLLRKYLMVSVISTSVIVLQSIIYMNLKNQEAKNVKGFNQYWI